jgi:N6-L-threonylcarbamoyladenine synthase
MLCLGIESSCDETALALVRDGELLGQTLVSQADMHSLFGGVVPELASREHGRAVAPLYDLLLERCGVGVAELEAVAVARGPGLLGSLLVGVAFAKALAWALGKPVVGVNHLHAHVLAVGLEQALLLPALALLVSGGHTHLYLVRTPVDFTLLGRSLDDAAGEALDKFGKMLGLPYPAGRHIDAFGARAAADAKLFPRPYLDNDNLDFSFSGLKTAALSMLEGRTERFMPGAPRGGTHGEPEPPAGAVGEILAGWCASFAQAVADTLEAKTRRALGRVDRSALRSVILAGGVAANSRVRERIGALCREFSLPFLSPSPAMCTDNAAMIAYAGEVLLKGGRAHGLDFPATARGGKVPDDYVEYLG